MWLDTFAGRCECQVSARPSFVSNAPAQADAAHSSTSAGDLGQEATNGALGIATNGAFGRDATNGAPGLTTRSKRTLRTEQRAYGEGLVEPLNES